MAGWVVLGGASVIFGSQDLQGLEPQAGVTDSPVDTPKVGARSLLGRKGGRVVHVDWLQLANRWAYALTLSYALPSCSGPLKPDTRRGPLLYLLHPAGCAVQGTERE